MKDKVVVTTDHPNTPASCKLTVADLQPVTWTQREDVVYWAPDGKGGIQIARKAPTIDGKTVAQSTTADTDRKSTRLNSSHIQKSRMPSSA